MPSIVYFLSNWGSTNYEMVIENRLFCQLQFGQVCSQTLKSIIVNEWRREVNSSCGTSGKARWRIQSELHIICCGFWPWTLDLMFQIESQVLSSDFFLDMLRAYLGCFFSEDNFPDSVENAQQGFFSVHAQSVDHFWQSPTCLLVCLLVEGKKIQNNWKAFYSDGHLGSEALLPICKVPPDLFCPSLFCSPHCASVFTLLYSLVCLPPISEPLLLLCPQAQSQIDMLNSQLGH